MQGFESNLLWNVSYIFLLWVIFSLTYSLYTIHTSSKLQLLLKNYFGGQLEQFLFKSGYNSGSNITAFISNSEALCGTELCKTSFDILVAGCQEWGSNFRVCHTLLKRAFLQHTECLIHSQMATTIYSMVYMGLSPTWAQAVVSCVHKHT